MAICTVLPALGICSLLMYYFRVQLTPSILICLLSCALAPTLLHPLWQTVFCAYRTWSERLDRLQVEIRELRSRLAAICSKYDHRKKGEQFKRAYNLESRGIRDLEEALSVGMHREKKEVFVTAFVRRGIAVRVTASIGSPFRCSAADDPRLWNGHIERLGCDAVLQYHNHPIYSGSTEPSGTDFRCSDALARILGSHAMKLRSFIIYWNEIGEWKVLEYDTSGHYWLTYEFDASEIGLHLTRTKDTAAYSQVR